MNKFAENNPAAIKLMNIYIGFLRAIYDFHQFSHWTIKGSSFYGDHLMMERLYESAQNNSDAAAEKTIGICGPESLNMAIHAQIVNDLVKKYENLETLEKSL